MENDDQEDEDDYVRQASRPRAGFRLSSNGHTLARADTPLQGQAHIDRGGAGINESTTSAAGSFMSAGDVENRLFVR
jgi:hypothetical protein